MKGQLVAVGRTTNLLHYLWSPHIIKHGSVYFIGHFNMATVYVPWADKECFRYGLWITHRDICMYYAYSIPQEICTRVFALLCFVVVIHWLIFPYPSDLLHWHWGNLTIAPVPAKQPWWIWINTSCEFIMNDYITTTKQSTTKPCAYFLGYTVVAIFKRQNVYMLSRIWIKKTSKACTARVHWISLHSRAPVT